MLMIFKELIKRRIKLMLDVLKFLPQQIPPFTLGQSPGLLFNGFQVCSVKKFLEPKGLNVFFYPLNMSFVEIEISLTEDI